MENTQYDNFVALCFKGCKPYKPKIKRKKQLILGSLVLGDIILPMTFGAGIFISKLITKLNPLFLYK